MIQPNQDTKKQDEALTSRELLKKSAELKERTARLKQQMEDTQKACNEILHPESNHDESRDQADN